MRGKMFFKFGLCLTLLATGSVVGSEAATKVYLIGGQDPTLPRNTVYLDLLSGGLTLLDDNNQEFTIPGLGWEVDFIDQAADSPADAAGYNLVIAHESVDSGNVAQYVDLPIPYLAIEQILAAGRTDRAGSIWFTDAAGLALPDGDYEFTILDNTHPITSRWQKDETIQITRSTNAQVSGILYDNIAPGVTALAETGTINNPFRVSLAVADKGATDFKGNDDAPIPAGADPAPARRGFLGYHERVQVYDNTATGIEAIAITKEAAILFQRVCQWMAGVAVTADGTPGGVQSDVAEWTLY